MLKLVRWRVLLSEFRFQIEHIPGSQNVGLNKIFHIDFEELSQSVHYLFKEDSTWRIFRIDNDKVEFWDTRDSDSKDEERWVENFQDKNSEVRSQKGEAVFEKFHNSVVGHLSFNRIYCIKSLNVLAITGNERSTKEIYIWVYNFPKDLEV